MIPGVNKPSLRVYLIGGPFRKVLVYFLHRSFWIRSESTSKPLKGTRSTHEWRESWFRWILLVLCPSIQPSNLDRDCGLFALEQKKRPIEKWEMGWDWNVCLYTNYMYIYIYNIYIYIHMYMYLNRHAYIHIYVYTCISHSIFCFFTNWIAILWLCGSRPVPCLLQWPRYVQDFQHAQLGSASKSGPRGRLDYPQRSHGKMDYPWGLELGNFSVA